MQTILPNTLPHNTGSADTPFEWLALAGKFLAKIARLARQFFSEKSSDNTLSKSKLQESMVDQKVKVVRQETENEEPMKLSTSLLQNVVIPTDPCEEIGELEIVDAGQILFNKYTANQDYSCHNYKYLLIETI